MRTLVFLALLGCVVPLHAGTEGVAWMRLPTDARTAALSGATGAWGVGAESLGNNPSGLTGTVGTEAVLTHAFWAQDVSREHLAVSRRLGNRFFAGLSLDYVGFGEIEAYELQGGIPVARGTFRPNAMAVGLAGGVSLAPRWSLGAQAKWLREDLDVVSDSTPAVDLGILFGEGPLRVGLSVLNVGCELNEADLPSTASLSASYRRALASPREDGTGVRQELGLMVQGDVGLTGHSNNTLGAGAEYRYADLLAFRAGYRGVEYGALSGVRGLSVGAGLTVRKMELSYALVTLGDMGKSSLISLKASF